MVGINLHGVEWAKIGETGWKEATYIVSTPNTKLG